MRGATSILALPKYILIVWCFIKHRINFTSATLVLIVKYGGLNVKVASTFFQSMSHRQCGRHYGKFGDYRS